MKKDPVADCVSVRPPPFIGRQKSPSRSWPQRLQTHRRRPSRLHSGHSNQVAMLSRKGNARRRIFSVACRPRSSGSKHPFSSSLRDSKECRMSPDLVVLFFLGGPVRCSIDQVCARVAVCPVLTRLPPVGAIFCFSAGAKHVCMKRGVCRLV